MSSIVCFTRSISTSGLVSTSPSSSAAASACLRFLGDMLWQGKATTHRPNKNARPLPENKIVLLQIFDFFCRWACGSIAATRHDGGRTRGDVRRGTSRSRSTHHWRFTSYLISHTTPTSTSLPRGQHEDSAPRFALVVPALTIPLPPSRTQAYRVRVLDADKYAKTQQLPETVLDFCDKVAQLSETVGAVVDAVDKQVRRAFAFNRVFFSLRASRRCRRGTRGH